MRILLSIGFKSWVNKSWHILHFTIGGCNPHDEASDTDSCEPLVPLYEASDTDSCEPLVFCIYL